MPLSYRIVFVVFMVLLAVPQGVRTRTADTLGGHWPLPADSRAVCNAVVLLTRKGAMLQATTGSAMTQRQPRPDRPTVLAERASEVLHEAEASIYSLREEIAHGVTHGIGALLAIAGLAVLTAQAALHGDLWHVVSVSIFGAALVLMYAASTLFHSIPQPKAKHVFRVLDHCLIYVLIAGTYTPFTLVTLRPTVGWWLFGALWGLALVGIGFKVFTTGRFEKLSLAVYLIMGWCGIVAVKPLLATLPAGGLWLLLAGGLSYSIGTIFYRWESLRYHHAIWHLFVLGGSVAHYFAVLLYVIPRG